MTTTEPGTRKVYRLYLAVGHRADQRSTVERALYSSAAVLAHAEGTPGVNGHIARAGTLVEVTGTRSAHDTLGLAEYQAGRLGSFPFYVETHDTPQAAWGALLDRIGAV